MTRPARGRSHPRRRGGSETESEQPATLAGVTQPDRRNVRAEVEPGLLLGALQPVRVHGDDVLQAVLLGQARPSRQAAADQATVHAVERRAVVDEEPAMGRTVEDLDIPDRTIEWADDLTVQHRSTREFIPIAHLT